MHSEGCPRQIFLAAFRRVSFRKSPQGDRSSLVGSARRAPQFNSSYEGHYNCGLPFRYLYSKTKAAQQYFNKISISPTSEPVFTTKQKFVNNETRLC
jgi:hypothetical protein